MSKFNIIEKYPKGQNENIIYTFIFQKDNKPKRWEQGKRNTPEHVLYMVQKILEYEERME